MRQNTDITMESNEDFFYQRVTGLQDGLSMQFNMQDQLPTAHVTVNLHGNDVDYFIRELLRQRGFESEAVEILYDMLPPEVADLETHGETPVPHTYKIVWDQPNKLRILIDEKISSMQMEYPEQPRQSKTATIDTKLYREISDFLRSCNIPDDTGGKVGGLINRIKKEYADMRS